MAETDKEQTENNVDRSSQYCNQVGEEYFTSVLLGNTVCRA